MANFLKDNRGFIIFILLFGVFRTAVADYNPIPSGSMRPTLVEGDVVLVNRLAYDLKLPLTNHVLLHIGEPRRGDVVTFFSPKDGTRLIKRLVGLPGDRVAVVGGVLIVNGERATYDHRELVDEPLAPGHVTTALRASESIGGEAHAVQFLKRHDRVAAFGPFTVPPDHYFMLGDSRDNSLDSRFIGAVPRELLIGRAHHVLLSADLRGNELLRGERTVMPIR